MFTACHSSSNHETQIYPTKKVGFQVETAAAYTKNDTDDTIESTV